MNMQFVNFVRKILMYRDYETYMHSLRVGCYSLELSNVLGFDQVRSQHIKFAAFVHDVGKIGVNESILFKTTSLSRDEFEHVKKHSLIGADILANSHFELQETAKEIALSHHEKYDGTGYPNGLCEEQIPVAARIVAVADVFDALTNDRPYRKALPREVALEIMLHDSGSYFDPLILSVFYKNIDTITRELNVFDLNFKLQ